MSKTPLILVATGIFPPDIGGPATYAKILAEELPAKGFRVEILNFGRVRVYPKLIRHFIYGLWVWRRSKEADFIYALDPVSVGLPVMVACFFRRRSYLIRIVGDYAWEQGSQRFGVTDLLDEFSARSSGYVWQVQLLKKIQKLVAGRAEKIVVASHYLKRIIGNWGVSTDKIRVIYNAFAVPKIPTVVPASQKPILVSVGRLVPWKGFSTLIDLMPRLLILEPDLELLIIGDGPDQRTLQTQIDQAQLTKQVKLLGRLDTETLFAYLSQATVFVLNTSYEGFSHQLLEVMAIGLPVVTTEVGGNPELITDQVTGLLVPYDDKEALSSAISHLLSQPKLRESLALAAKAKVAEFSKTRMLSEVVSLFQTHENL